MVMGVVGGVGAIFALINFFIVPTIADWKKDSAKALELEKKIRQDRDVIRTYGDYQKQLEQTQESIRVVSSRIPMPVLGNYLLAMEDSVRAAALGLDLVVKSVSDNDIIEPWGGAGLFKIYRVRVVIQSGYAEFIRFVSNIETENPLVSLGGVSISARAETPERHDISFIVGWMIWADPEKRPAFITAVSSNAPIKAEIGNNP